MIGFVLSALVAVCVQWRMRAGGGASGVSNAASSMVGVHAPSFAAFGHRGRRFRAKRQGQGLVVDFWATYCKPCEKEFPKLQALVDRTPARCVVYALSEDETHRRHRARSSKKTGVKFPIGWDDGNSISQHYKLEKMPTSYIVDKKGIIRFVHGGYGEGEERADRAARVDELLR